MHLRGRIGIALALGVLPLTAARADVVINEIFYNAPDDLTELQWVEVHNTGAESVDIGGWKLDKGKLFTFPHPTRIDAGGFVVVAQQPAPFTKAYGAPALGPFKRPLQRGGERLELTDASDRVMDRARYSDRAPWPVSADGYSASLERICLTSPGDVAENWAASPLPALAPKPSGTPGARNACFAPGLPPVIRGVRLSHDEPNAGAPLKVEVEIPDRSGLREVTLLYRTVTGRTESAESAIPMTLDEAGGRHRAEIPPQPAGTLVRYRIRAVNAAAGQRLFPDENDLRPALSTYVHDPWPKSSIPLGFIIATATPPVDRSMFGPFQYPRPGRPMSFREMRAMMERQGPPPGGDRQGDRGTRGQGDKETGEGREPREGRRRSFFDSEAPEPRAPRGVSAYLYVEPTSGKALLFDFIHVVSRDRGPMYRGYKVLFHKDQPLHGMTAVNLVMEGSEAFLLSEALAYDLYHRLGHAAPHAEFARLWVDGKLDGYHLMVERPNRSFLRRNRIDDQGDLYKLIWYGANIVEKHDKKTNPRTGHKDLLALIDALRKSQGEARWKLIRDNFNVNQVATYFAVNMVLSHWDGFFNNYYAYHDRRGTKKWEIYPWDQDKTWGYHDALEPREIFYDMPLRFGMAGAKPPPPPPGFVNPFGPPPGGEPETRRQGDKETRRQGGRVSSRPTSRRRVPASPRPRVPASEDEGDRLFQEVFGHGGPMWWRPPGFFSGPLIADPHFRTIYLSRIKEILASTYTQGVFFPIIDAMADRIREDVLLRSKLRGASEAEGLHALAENVQMLKTHLLKRRQYLLSQTELRSIGTTRR